MSADNYLITDQNVVYFLTFTVTNWVDIFTRKAYKIEIVDSLNYCIQNKGLTIFAWYASPPRLQRGGKLSRICNAFNSGIK